MASYPGEVCVLREWWGGLPTRPEALVEEFQDKAGGEETNLSVPGRVEPGTGSLEEQPKNRRPQQREF